MSKKRLDELGVSAFCESMAMMIQAGIQTDEAVALLQSENRDGGMLEQGLSEMKTLIEQGSGLAEAMKSVEIFPDFAVRMIAAGESSGRLEDVLFRLARYYAEQKTISEKLRGAVTYPAAMLLLILAVLTVMLTIVLPAFRAVYDRLTGSLAASSYAYIRWAGVFCTVALVMMALLACALLVGLLLWKSGRRAAVEAVLEKFPRCRSILETNALFRFTSATGTFLASGEMQDEAVLSSIPMADYGPVEQKLKKLAGRMEEGHSLAQAAYDEQLFEPVYGRMLLAGERSGGLEHVLGRLTELLEENSVQQVDRLVEIVGPALSGVLMLTIGLTLISVMLPLIGMMNAIG
ncbi:MAG: type II secretion system F family protein [Oscillospiraceae bacterium]|nr:type II secretion system F family protein [Oscillospiraceae bacterium]